MKDYKTRGLTRNLPPGYLHKGTLIIALLKDEQHDPLIPIPDEYLGDELEALYKRLLPDDLAIRCARELPKKHTTPV